MMDATSRVLPFDPLSVSIHTSNDPASIRGRVFLCLPPFFIVGPTAVGKTALAVAVAERCNAEIVNADAFQLYAGLDLLTAKPSLNERNRAAHHLVGTVPLRETYNVALYQATALRCLDEIAHRQRPAIVVGGSGMYVKALTHGLSPLPPAQPAIRAELDILDLETLFGRLRTLDPITAEIIDAKNRRRLVRAIEVCLTTGRRFSDFRERWVSPLGGGEPVGVFLTRNKTDLHARIKDRVKSIFSLGLVEEIRAMRAERLSVTASQMIGWSDVQEYLSGLIDLKNCIEKVETATRRYAKRQMTWFRGENMFEEISLSDGDDASCAVDIICGRLLSLSSKQIAK